MYDYNRNVCRLKAILLFLWVWSRGFVARAQKHFVAGRLQQNVATFCHKYCRHCGRAITRDQNRNLALKETKHKLHL